MLVSHRYGVFGCNLAERFAILCQRELLVLEFYAWQVSLQKLTLSSNKLSAPNKACQATFWIFKGRRDHQMQTTERLEVFLLLTWSVIRCYKPWGTAPDNCGDTHSIIFYLILALTGSQWTRGTLPVEISMLKAGTGNLQWCNQISLSALLRCAAESAKNHGSF